MITPRHGPGLAMHDAAFTSAEYASYAAQAMTGGQQALARLFTGAAAAELQGHFAAEAALAGTVCQTQCNLRSAAISARLLSRIRYPLYAHCATAAGDTRAARVFERDAAGANADAFAFEQALDNLRAP